MIQLSNGTFLVAGSATNLDWIPVNVFKTQLGNINGINNGQGSNRFGFLLHLHRQFAGNYTRSSFCSRRSGGYPLSKNDKHPDATGDIYLSGNTTDTKANDGGYFIAKLKNNFVNGLPDALDWSKSIWAEGYPEEYQPWDVATMGRWSISVVNLMPTIRAPFTASTKTGNRNW